MTRLSSPHLKSRSRSRQTLEGLPERPKFWRIRLPRTTGLIALLAMVAMINSGCTQSGSPGTQRSGGGEVQAARSGDVLLQDVIATLNNLPNYVNTELRPPTIVLDATTSRDGKTVMAVVSDHPQQPTGRNDIVYATTRNSRFRRLEVRPGDRVRLFVLRDEYGKQDFVEMVVQEVLSESMLRVVGGLNEAVRTPERLEIWRYADERIVQILTRLRQYTDRRPVLGWEPTPDEAALEQMIDRLNQWARQRTPSEQWSLDPLVSTLPEPLQKYADPDDLAELTFHPYEARLLQESIWLRDIAQWAKDEALDDVSLAKELFDWTVRNVQLVSREALDGRMHRPWQTLMYGRGTVEERAWIFSLLARQQGLDVVTLAYADPQQPEQLRFWLSALLSDGDLYLFDPQLGLPIPTADGEGVATLAQVREDESLLRRLDLDTEQPYPVQASDLENVVALVEGSPLALSQRARLLEEKLVGENRVVLTSRPSAIAKAVEQAGPIRDVRLWDLPYQTRDEQLTRDQRTQRIAALEFQVFAWRPLLWKARVLHFQGNFAGEDSAKTLYRRLRPSDERIDETQRHDIEKDFIRQAKMHASYWLGLLTFDSEEYPVAEDFFLNRTLEATPEGPWAIGAQYNLGRTYEVLGQTDRAKELYTTDDSLQSHGNRLRARWLEEPAADDEGAESLKNSGSRSRQTLGSPH